MPIQSRSVPCPTCGVQPGARCVDPQTGEGRSPHPGRKIRAKRGWRPDSESASQGAAPAPIEGWTDGPAARRVVDPAYGAPGAAQGRPEPLGTPAARRAPDELFDDPELAALAGGVDDEHQTGPGRVVRPEPPGASDETADGDAASVSGPDRGRRAAAPAPPPGAPEQPASPGEHSRGVDVQSSAGVGDGHPQDPQGRPEGQCDPLQVKGSAQETHGGGSAEGVDEPVAATEVMLYGPGPTDAWLARSRSGPQRAWPRVEDVHACFQVRDLRRGRAPAGPWRLVRSLRFGWALPQYRLELPRQVGVGKDPCRWNPWEDRMAEPEDQQHGDAVWTVSSADGSKVRVCGPCSGLRRFSGWRRS